ncbi:DUF6383 domain-containing protein [Parabacteroides sp. PF5-6]|uniref:DUF6383 domain-containing protein n=1 Tax=Parabacteroides sp. PF5-6 TaxID=1742403 RepID=UPI002405C5C0|nr:DUF6383 domain-containing protein [Parabacteroides sp. PF5-6]MDF9830286.1 hypothetical protein [Parabacteroides sp. PF5-6]
MTTNILFLVLILIYFIMNKKFFTLLVALFAMISFGASALKIDPNGPADGDKFVSTKSYLLGLASGYTGEAAGAEFLAVDTKGEKLVAISMPASLNEFQRASWKITVKNGVYQFVNDFTGTVLTLNSATAAEEVGDIDNTIGGDITEWIATTVVNTVLANQKFFSRVADSDEIIALAIDGGKIGAMIFEDETKMRASGDVLELTPYTTTGTFVLSPNELNTQLGKTGVYDADRGELVATMESTFSLTLSPAPTNGSPLELSLQAQAVERHELAYGEDPTKSKKHVWLTSSLGNPGAGDYWKESVDNANFISMYPYGTWQKDSDPEMAVKYKGGDWYALKAGDKYLVVDTSYVDGTGQVNNGLIHLTTDDLYNSKDAKTRLRHPDSYLFKAYYNANGTLSLVSKLYITKAAANGQVAADNTKASDYYSGKYVAPMVLKGAMWPASAAVDFQQAEKELTYARLGSTYVYTLTKDNAEPEKGMVIKISDSKEYTVAKITNGAYLLKVVGVFDAKNKGRIGKYAKMSLDGTFEYVEKAPRQNFHHMPAAQWVFETTGSSTYATTKITNREFTNVQTENFSNNGVTYKGSADKTFFFLGGDTLAYEAVADVKTATIGYKVIPAELNSRYILRYLHNLAMDRPVDAKSDLDSAIWVASDADSKGIRFTIEKQFTDAYGYKTTAVAGLTRDVYKLKVTDHYQFGGRYVTYNKDSKKYFLTEKAADATLFFLKENNEVEGGDCYYTLVEVNFIKDLAKAKIDPENPETLIADNLNSTTKFGPFVYHNGNLFGNGWLYVEGTKGSATNEGGVAFDTWVPKEYSGAEDIWEDDPNFVNTGREDSKGQNIYYRWYRDNQYAKSKVSVDNNTLDLTWGILEDANSSEIVNSAFSIEVDKQPLYRDLGEDLTIAKIFRAKSEATGKEYLYEDANSVYSTPVNGEDNKDRVSQINFLGVEGKGMTKNSAMNIKYQRGSIMPQYLIGFDFKDVEDEVVSEVCDECQGLDPNCTHNKTEKVNYMTGRFLVSLADSVAAYTGADKEKFQLEKKYTRLAFVEGKLVKDEKDVESLVIASSALEAKKNTIDVSTVDKDSKEGVHTPVLFSFRLMNDEEAADFMIESKANAVAGTTGEWVKIQNGVPVLTGSISLTDAMGNNEAEIFNLEVTEENPTSNGMIDAAKVDVVAGQGFVTIKGAAGQQVVVANILGQVVANVVLDRDEATIAAPAGVVVVSVNGVATKALVK